ncbi:MULTISPECIES: HAD-IIIA family hydrolase [unclassified Microcoleus]|uniref:HAD-IIIA family hydrolase n=1 Tax=unclassified Microcoleus TaxID=2642155 RepID=UPI002FCE8F45
MSKTIFFDLDGTLRQTKSGETFISDPADQQPIEGMQRALAYYQEKGIALIGITNQAGVAAGHKSLESAIEEQRVTLAMFPELSEIFFCPSFDGGNCWQVSRDNEPLKFLAPVSGDGLIISCRKPGHGMIVTAARGLTDLSDCWMIGDRPEDEVCAKSAEIKFVWASVLHAKFSAPGIKEIDCLHLDPDVLMQFLGI